MKPDLSILNNIGSARDVLQGNTKSPLLQFVQSNLQELVEEIKKTGNKMDVRASNSLLSSIIVSNIKVSGEKVDGEIIGEDYWKFINFGVNGSIFKNAPNWEALGFSKGSLDELIGKVKVWMPFRNVKPKENQTFDELAEKIAISIIKKGKRPRPFVTQTLQETKKIKELADGIGKIIGKSLATDIKFRLENGNNSK